MSSRISEKNSEQVVLRGLSWRLYFENREDLFIYRCIKIRVVLFQTLLKFFSKMKSINRALCNMWV